MCIIDRREARRGNGKGTGTSWRKARRHGYHKLDWDGRDWREWRVRYSGGAEGADGGRCPQVAGLHQGLPSITPQRREAIGQASLQKEPGGVGEGVKRVPFLALHGAQD